MAPLPIHPAVRLLAAPDSAAADEALSPLLGAADHRRASLRRHPEARRRTRIGRGLVRVLAADLLGIAAEEVVSGASPAGAPYARAPDLPESRAPAPGALAADAVAVSVTHTRGLVAAAASAEARRIGVDVERLDRRTRPEAIARRHFLPPETRILLALPEPARPAAFLRAWTLKEAWGKAAGVAVPAALSRVAFDLSTPPPSSEATAREHHALKPGAPSDLQRRSPWRFWTTTYFSFTLAVAAGFPPADSIGASENLARTSR